MMGEDIVFGQVADYNSELDTIRSMALHLRRLRKNESLLRWEEPAEWTVKYSNMYNKPEKALTITLTPTGCQWANSGGCTMCGEFEGSRKSVEINPMYHIAQFSKAIADLIPSYKPTWLRINQEGNFANSQELGKIAQETILKLAVQLQGIKRITIEARPDFLTEDLLKSYNQIIYKSGIELEIGMGFESKNDVVRNICINKGESIEIFVKTLGLMKEYSILPLAYIILKPPFLTEGEAIQEAVDTIFYASALGFKRISLEPMSIHKYTIVDALSRVGKYRVPWLWSVIEVIKRCKEVPELGIGGIGFYPRPYHLSQNHCNRDCNKAMWEALKNYGKYRNFSVFESLDCDCKSEWEKDCAKSNIHLAHRISAQLSSVDINEYQKQVTNDTISPSPESKHNILIAEGSQSRYVSKGSNNEKI